LKIGDSKKKPKLSLIKAIHFKEELVAFGFRKGSQLGVVTLNCVKI